MEVKRNKAEPLPLPPDTYDITGLSKKEAQALRELLIRGLTWDEQGDLEGFFRGLYHALDRDVPMSRYVLTIHRDY